MVKAYVKGAIVGFFIWLFVTLVFWFLDKVAGIDLWWYIYLVFPLAIISILSGVIFAKAGEKKEVSPEANVQTTDTII